MEFFDEVVIEGTGRDCRLVAKDDVTQQSVILNEEEFMTSYSSGTDAVTIADKRVQLKSRQVFPEGVGAKAFADAISQKAHEVNRARMSIFFSGHVSQSNL